MEIKVPSKYVSGQTIGAYLHGYKAASANKEAQVYGGKLTKEAYLDGYRQATEDSINAL